MQLCTFVVSATGEAERQGSHHLRPGAWNQLEPHSGISHKTSYEVGIYVAQLEGACVVCEKTDLILGSQLIVHAPRESE